MFGPTFGAGRSPEINRIFGQAWVERPWSRQLGIEPNQEETVTVSTGFSPSYDERRPRSDGGEALHIVGSDRPATGRSSHARQLVVSTLPGVPRAKLEPSSAGRWPEPKRTSDHLRVAPPLPWPVIPSQRALLEPHLPWPVPAGCRVSSRANHVVSDFPLVRVPMFGRVSHETLTAWDGYQDGQAPARY